MTSTSEKFYDRFSFLYPAVDLFLAPQKNKFFDKINNLPHGHVLDIGVGNGSTLKFYKSHKITGIDTSKSMLAKAQKHTGPHMELVHMNGEALNFPNEAFDYVILSHVIAVVENPEKLLEEVHRVLKPNGKIFILNHFTPASWLKYVDQSLEAVFKMVHVKSVFNVSSLKTLEKFKRLSQCDVGLFSYFKILIYEKNH
jgi:phosphatidylethanolamine/phosphatidyl-N-methylethanolamine N-methyltransferase